MYITPILWVPINLGQIYWLVSPAGTVRLVSSDGTKSTSSISGIIDTGTSFLLGPATDVQAVCSWLGLSYISSNGFCSDFCCGSREDCDSNGLQSYPLLNKIPDFFLNFGGNYD